MLNFRLVLIHCLTILNGNTKESFIQPLLLAVANHSSPKNDSFLIHKLELQTKVGGGFTRFKHQNESGNGDWLSF